MARSVIAVLAAATLFFAGCGGSESTTTSATSSTTATTSPATATTSSTTSTTSAVTSTEVSGPKAFPVGSLIGPGEYVTTTFEPVVAFRIDENPLLRTFEEPVSVGFQNRPIWVPPFAPNVEPYKGIGVHNWWIRLTPDEIVDQLDKIEAVNFESPTALTVGGFPATSFGAFAEQRVVIWEDETDPINSLVWFLHPQQQMRLIIVDTPAGSLVITAQADAEEWDAFLPRAEEIVGGISFPELE